MMANALDANGLSNVFLLDRRKNPRERVATEVVSPLFVRHLRFSQFILQVNTHSFLLCVIFDPRTLRSRRW